jgi:hypothetical protein
MQLETETVIHRTLLKLGRDSDILNLINELYENPELIEELRKNCSSVLRQRGILLPEGVTVSVIEEPGRGVRADFTINGTKVFAQWSPKVGFFITTEYAPSPLPGTLSLTRNRTR